eukprot:7377-Heterococcus_DN1.PRE.1
MTAPASAKAAGDKTVWNLYRESALRCEVAADKSFTVVLTALTAENFGVELAAQTEYHFRGTQLAVFTSYGSTLETSGTAERVYISDETPTVPCAKTHTRLEARRENNL